MEKERNGGCVRVYINYKESQIGTELELKFLKIGIIKRKKKFGGQIERERERGGDEMRGCEMKWAWYFLNNL